MHKLPVEGKLSFQFPTFRLQLLGHHNLNLSLSLALTLNDFGLTNNRDPIYLRVDNGSLEKVQFKAPKEPCEGEVNLSVR